MRTGTSETLSRCRSGRRSAVLPPGRAFVGAAGLRERRRLLNRRLAVLQAVARAIDRRLEPFLLHRLEEIVDGVQLERFDRVVVERGDERDERQRVRRNPPDHLEAADLGHLQIQEREMGSMRGDELHRFLAGGSLGDELRALARLDETGQEPAGRPLVVGDDERQRGRRHKCRSVPTPMPSPIASWSSGASSSPGA